MSDEQPPRSPRAGGPRRPSGSRARAGGSARPVPPASPSRATPSREGSARPARAPTPTRALPASAPPPSGRSARPARGFDARAYGEHGGDAHLYGEDRGAGIGSPGAAASSGGPDGPAGPVGPDRPGRRSRRRRSRVPRPLRLATTLLVLVLVIVVGWGAGLTLWANSRIEHVDALSGAADTPGTTYLIAGSDRRGGEAVTSDGTEGARSDTIMLLHRARNGNSYLVSLPRDTLVDIPGYGKYKLNAAFSFGGPSLLVETVEQFTGLTIDHYVEVGFDGVAGIVDAVGTVNLCIDQDVDDEKSGLVMSEGCHDVGGEQALAFVRARYFDPTADIGRQGRQQQFVSALMDRVASPSVLLNPVAQARLAGAGSDALITSEGTGMLSLARMGLTARSAMGSGTLQMPYVDPNYQTTHSGVAILVDDEEIADFFSSIEDGSAEVPEGS